MFKRFTSVIICIFLFSGLLLAQDQLSETTDKTPDLSSTARGAVLWDNMLPVSTTGIVSSLYGGLTAPNNIVQCAEDFTVPTGVVWNITEVLATGFYSATSATATNFGIDFFENTGGAPGNLIAQRTISNPGVDPVTGTFPVLTLGPGTYWVSIYGRHDTSTVVASFRWNWYASANPNIIGIQPHIRDLSGLFGGLPWTPFSGLGLAFGGLLFQLHGEEIVPVELTSFTASIGNGNINLKWQTATEINNYGFEIQRASNDSKFVTIGFVAGNGTTTETKNYNYTDKSVTSGAYAYRLKQVDYDGRFEYSGVIEVDFQSVPTEFALNQNFPNPFNPATKINFKLPVESNVTIKIFNVIGEEVSNLLKGTLSAGSHNVDFNASDLNSGVYFYSLEALGTDGSSFSEVKKMMLTK